ncbi:MAG: L,D-transpeptidase [Anaerolineae bacterium]|nr:L,D-transpeptidase [Anaerolineae bacterium]
MKQFIRIVLLLITITSLTGIAQAVETPQPEVAAPMQEGSPPVAQLGVDFGVVGGYRYMQIVSNFALAYSAPGGGRIVRRFNGGYDFVTPRGQQGDWVEINVGEWMHVRHLREVYPSYFSGVLVQGDTGIPWGWILVSHYASASPGGPEVRDPAYRVQRYNLTHFYETTVVDGWRWYNVGNGRWVKQTLVSKVQNAPNPGVGGRWVAVDLYEQNLVAYEGNTMVFATLISSGLPGTDTNPGVFQVWARTANAPMNGQSGGYGNYRLENVPYAIYFDGDISLHGTYWHNRFGYRQSRGCVNLSISDARWLFDWLGEGGVYVYYSDTYR